MLTSAKDGLIRWSKIEAEMRNGGASKLADEVEKALVRENPICDEHGKLDDPIVALESESRHLIWACPFCAGPAVRALWETQGDD